MSKPKYWIGTHRFRRKQEVFRSTEIPTVQQWGLLYTGVILGGFRTRRAANFVLRHGCPHNATIEEIEQLAKQEGSSNGRSEEERV
jgi:hypothetical protein